MFVRRLVRLARTQHARVVVPRTRPAPQIAFRRWATASGGSHFKDPSEMEAETALEEGTRKLEEGDILGAKASYERSVEIKRTASSMFNLGVVHYHLKDFDAAIDAWKTSIDLQPSSPDAHTNLASAYVISPKPRPDLALHHLQIASSLAPEDPEIAFNLAAVHEACGHLEQALENYQRSERYGVERASIHIRNVSAKIFGQKLKEAESQLATATSTLSEAKSSNPEAPASSSEPSTADLGSSSSTPGSSTPNPGSSPSSSSDAQPPSADTPGKKE